MKKLIPLSGFTAAFLLTFGAILKITHLPYADISMVLGYLLLILLFTPLVTVENYRLSQNKSLFSRAKMILGLATFIVLGLSFLFKLIHLQGADYLLIMGSLLFVLGFLPLYFYSIYQKYFSAQRS